MTNSEEVHVWFQDHRIGLKRMLVNNASSYQFDFVSFIILMYNMVLITVYREDSKVLSTCDVFCLLAHESCDISKPETKISLVKSWTHKKKILSKWQFFSNLILSLYLGIDDIPKKREIWAVECKYKNLNLKKFLIFRWCVHICTGPSMFPSAAHHRPARARVHTTQHKQWVLTQDKKVFPSCFELRSTMTFKHENIHFWGKVTHLFLNLNILLHIF